MLPQQLPDLTSPYCMQKESSLPAIVEVDGWPPLGYKYGGARAPVVHLFLLRLILLPCFISILDANDTNPQIPGRREGEGSPGGT